jgi:malate synthase
MEDAATAEIARAQIWQWINHPGGVLSDGRKVTAQLFREILDEELQRLKGGRANLDGAARLLEEITLAKEFRAFLTLDAYQQLH